MGAAPASLALMPDANRLLDKLASGRLRVFSVVTECHYYLPKARRSSELSVDVSFQAKLSSV